MLDNDGSTLMEEGEDILDGLELMTESGEVSNSFLVDCTDIITTLIVARNLENEEVMPTFQKAGNHNPKKKLTRQNRAGSMAKIRKELLSLENRRKPFNMRTWAEENFQDMEVKKVKRTDSSRRMENQGVGAEEVENKYIQDRGRKIQLVGSDVLPSTPPWRQ